MGIELTDLTANLDIKSKAPNGVTFNVKGRATHEGKNAGGVSVFSVHYFSIS